MARAVCVYCASSSTVPAVYTEAARELGAAMARRGHDLVYGGGKVGLMGKLADAVLAGGGRVIGVIPEALRDLELAHPDAHEMIVTPDMRERKATMARRASAFVALPGGFGTLEEILEAIAHHQLRFHTKPCVILNVDGFYNSLLAQFDRAIREGFVERDNLPFHHVAATADETLDFIEGFPVE